MRFSKFCTIILEFFSKIINDLDDLSNEASSKPSQTLSSEVTSDIKNAGQYIFTLKQSQQKQVTARITDLEQKISKLETLIGSNTNQVVRNSYFLLQLFTTTPQFIISVYRYVFVTSIRTMD